jgi:hypothetical protein
MSKISFMSASEGLTLLIELYPEIKTCQALVDKAMLDGIITLREAQYLLRVPSVWFNVSTENFLDACSVGKA